MKLKNLLAASFLIAPALANAQGIESVIEPVDGGRVPVYFHLGSLGGVSQTGFGFGYKLSNQSEINFSYQFGNIDLKNRVTTDRNIEVTDAELNAAQIKVFSRHYPWEGVFNVIAGLGFRTIETKIGVIDTSDISGISGKTESNAITANIGISSIWKFDSGLRIGADWLEASMPLSSEGSSSFASTGNLGLGEQDAKNSFVDLANKLADDTLLEVKAHIGYEF